MSCWYTPAEDERKVRSWRSCVCACSVDVSRGGGGTTRDRGDGGGFGGAGTAKSWVRAENAGRLVFVPPAVMGVAVVVVVVVVVVGVALTPDGLLRCPFATGGGGGGIDVVDGRRVPGTAALALPRSCFDVAPYVFDAPLFAPVPALALVVVAIAVAVVVVVAVLSVFPALDLRDMALPNPPSLLSGALSTVAALPLDSVFPSFVGSLVEPFRDGLTIAPTPSTLPRLLLAAVAGASFSSSVLALPAAAETEGVLPVLRGGASFAALFLFLRLAARGADGNGGGGILAASCSGGEPLLLGRLVPGEVELVPMRGCGGENRGELA